jgi:hypothetical protein
VPFRDKVVLVAKNRLYRRTAVGYSAISGSLLSRISLIRFQFRVPAFKFPRVVDTGKLQEIGDGGCAGDVLSRPDGEFRVTVEGNLSAREVAD